jgi:hypothetical protein
MLSKQMVIAAILLLVLNCIIYGGEVKKGIHFSDDFENGTGKWEFTNPGKIKIIDSGNGGHRNVLALRSGGPGVYALVKNSDGWTNLRVEGDVYFPYYYHHYLGLIYNYNNIGKRIDFGSIFLLGPYGEDFDPYYQKYAGYQENPPDGFLGNVVLVNPHRDSNASRLLYSEYWVTLSGDSAVRPGEWHRFKAEIVGPVCHFYVGDMKTPKITYDYFEFSSGRVGFKPRYVGSECWIDNIAISSIDELSYKGPGLPEGRKYEPEALITKWDVIGPFSRRMREIETDGYLSDKSYAYNNGESKWKPFEADPRGCVASGRVVEMYSGEWFAYFHTEIPSESKKDVMLHFGTTNSLGLWINNTFIRNVPGHFTIWPDFRTNPKHEGVKIKVSLEAGVNHMIVLVKGGRYGGDGFYVCCESGKEEKK